MGRPYSLQMILFQTWLRKWSSSNQTCADLPCALPSYSSSLFCVWISTKDPNCQIQVLFFHLGSLAPDAEWDTADRLLLDTVPPGIIWLVLFWFFFPFNCPFCLLCLLPFLNVGISQESLLDSIPQQPLHFSPWLARSIQICLSSLTPPSFSHSWALVLNY